MPGPEGESDALLRAVTKELPLAQRTAIGAGFLPVSRKTPHACGSNRTGPFHLATCLFQLPGSLSRKRAVCNNYLLFAKVPKNIVEHDLYKRDSSKAVHQVFNAGQVAFVLNTVVSQRVIFF